MKPPTSEDLQFLRDIRGQFQDTKSNQMRDNVLYILLGVLFPVILLVFFFLVHDQMHWIFVVGAFGLFALTANLWRDRSPEYEFNGEEIIEKRAGRIRSQICISDVINYNVDIFKHLLVLKTAKSTMTITILPSLNQAIQKTWAESLAAKSESERKGIEKANQEFITRVRRSNLIVVFILIAVTVAIGLLIIWLKGRK